MLSFLCTGLFKDFSYLESNLEVSQKLMKINFLGLKPPPAEEADVIILPIPYEGTVSYMPGTRFGPKALLEASYQLEEFDCELFFNLAKNVGIHTLDPMEPVVSGPEGMLKSIQEKIMSGEV